MLDGAARPDGSQPEHIYQSATVDKAEQCLTEFEQKWEGCLSAHRSALESFESEIDKTG